MNKKEAAKLLNKTRVHPQRIARDLAMRSNKRCVILHTEKLAEGTNCEVNLNIFCVFKKVGWQEAQPHTFRAKYYYIEALTYNDLWNVYATINLFRAMELREAFKLLFNPDTGVLDIVDPVIANALEASKYL